MESRATGHQFSVFDEKSWPVSLGRFSKRQGKEREKRKVENHLGFNHSSGSPRPETTRRLSRTARGSTERPGADRDYAGDLVLAENY